MCDNREPELLPENIDAWQLYKSACTQWRMSGIGDRVGLDYPAIYTVADTLMLDMTPAMLAKIQAIEAAAIEKSRKKNDEVTT